MLEITCFLQEYWDLRYTASKGKTFDWYDDYSTFRKKVRSFLFLCFAIPLTFSCPQLLCRLVDAKSETKVSTESRTESFARAGRSTRRAKLRASVVDAEKTANTGSDDTKQAGGEADSRPLPTIEEIKKMKLRTLVVGCGNSLLSEELHRDGLCDVLSTDFSEVVIDQMTQRYQVSLPSLQFKTVEAQQVHRDHPEEFDVVVDKGTLDAVLCSGDNSAKAGGRMLFSIFKVSSLTV
jgi:hypothetical protein